MHKKQFNEYFALRCTPADRDELRRVSQSLSIAESAVARAALRAGLRVIGNQGIQPKRDNQSVQAED